MGSYTFGPGFPLSDGDALLIVPPFYDIARPSLAAHLLQACAASAGFRVSVLYANVLLAAELGPEAYTRIGFPKEYPPHALAGERFFARQAHDLPALGLHGPQMLDLVHAFGPSWAPRMRISRLARAEELHELLPDLAQLETRAHDWLERLAGFIAHRPFRVVGCSSTFNETNASFALLKRLKARDPRIVTLLGGANCEGELADAIVTLDPDQRVIDFVFSGDSEETFVRFLGDLRSEKRLDARVISGRLCTDLEGLPAPDYTEFFEQRASALPDAASTGHPAELLYETSRGCWWGEQRQCTFCGTNGDGVEYRHKSAPRVLDDLRGLAERYPGASVYMTDSVMPDKYFATLVPALAKEGLPLSIGYGQRADLELRQVMSLVGAGIDLIQPGIEALSTGLLHRMHKGTVSRQNVALLRYARASGLSVLWALLWGLPGDRRSEYEETIAVLPLLRHLAPPGSLLHISVDRFSPYFREPDRYGITDIRPLGGYADVFPAEVDVAGLAHHFTAEYDCESHHHLDLIEAIASEVQQWQAAWEPGGSQPMLHVARTGEGKYLLFDTRGLGETTAVQVLDRPKATVALTEQPDTDTPEVSWALEQKVGVLLDGQYVPLATADPELLLEFEAEARGQRQDTALGGRRRGEPGCS